MKFNPERRRFLKYAGAGAVVLGAAALGISKYKEFLPSSSSQISTTSQTISSSSSTSSLKTYDVTLNLFHNLPANGKHRSDQSPLKYVNLAISDSVSSTTTVVKPDKDGTVKIPDLKGGVEYLVKPAFLTPTDPSALFRYITPSNSNFVSFDKFRLMIDSNTDPQDSDYINLNGYRLRLSPDNLHADLHIVHGPATWPFLDSSRKVAYRGPLRGGYMDISLLYGGKTRDWMGGSNTYPDHSGDDIIAPSLGTPSLSIMPGIVIYTRSDWPAGEGGDPWDENASASNRTGNYVLIQHPEGFQSEHSHLDKVSVNVDDVVKRGQPVGTVGYTGRALASYPENDLILFKISTSNVIGNTIYYNQADLFRALEIPSAATYWSLDSNPQKPDDPQSPIPD